MRTLPETRARSAQEAGKRARKLSRYKANQACTASLVTAILLARWLPLILETPVTHTAQGFQWLLGFAKLVVLLLVGEPHLSRARPARCRLGRATYKWAAARRLKPQCYL